MKTDSVNHRLIVATGSNNLLHYFYLDNGRISHFYIEDPCGVNTGNIYIGLVSNVCKGIDGYFVNVTPNEQVFLPGKASEHAILINRDYNGKLYESDLIIIQITKEAHKSKKAAATTKIKIPSGIEKDSLIQLSRTKPKYSLLYKGKSYLDILDYQYNGLMDCNIICADKYAFDYVTSHYNDKYHAIRLYEDSSISLSALYSLKSKFDNITNEKVWLKNGGYLYINPTEALTVIDINTGKTDGKDREKTLLDTNLEAIEEIAHQIKARNLSGIIIVDLINGKAPDSNTILTKHMTECFSHISPAPKLEDITKLGLAEITRQKILPDIYELLPRFDKTILM